MSDQTTDPVEDFLSAGGTPGAPQNAPSGDPTHDFLTSGGSQIPATTPALHFGSTIKEAGGALALRAVSGLGANILAGGRAIYDLASGKSLAETDTRAQQFIREHTYAPQEGLAKTLSAGVESKVNPLNWPGMAISGISDVVGEQTGSPAAAGATTGILQGGLGLLGLRGGMEPLTGTPVKGFPSTAPAARIEPTLSAAPRAMAFEPEDIPSAPGTRIDTEPVEGGLPPAASGARAQILQRVGLENARESALTGNAKEAATDFQLSRFDEPAGVAAKAQFDAERQALARHAEGIVRQTGGTLGTDEDSLNIRGQTIARPFDALSDWFDQQRKQLYQAADARSGGHPVVQPASLQSLLDDRSFQNQLTARDQLHIRNGVASELQRFQESNPQGLTVQNAEQFRQFLNSLWSPQTSSIIGRLKGALDDDVMKGAGEDIYGPARQLAQIEKQTLENPSGINKLMERDPQTPINRTTSFDKIPDTLSRLPPAQFDQVIKTLQSMPEAIQPEAQSALAEIKAHLANKIHDAGNATQGQWNARGVEKVVTANSAKLQSAFADQPEVLQQIQDLRSAGKILRVDQSYPGAAAQASNMLRRGMMGRVLSSGGATVGGAAGATAGSILGPFGTAGGAATGAAMGEALGARIGRNAMETAALKKWQAKVKPTTQPP